jgi:hypothetical protein
MGLIYASHDFQHSRDPLVLQIQLPKCKEIYISISSKLEINDDHIYIYIYIKKV